MPFLTPWEKGDSLGDICRKILQGLKQVYDNQSGGGGGGGGGVVQQGAKDATAQSWLVDGSATTQPISAASLPLPALASTAALQSTGNTSLASLDSKLPAQGAALIVASTPVNIASNQTVPISAASLPLPTGAATDTLQGTGNTSLSSIDGKTPALGQALAASSVPVVLTAIQVSALTPPAAITNFAIETGGNLATVAAAVVSQEATTSGVKGVTAFGAVTTNAPSYTTAKSDALSMDTSGLLRVSVKDTPANTNKFLVTPDLPSGASTGAKQDTGNTSLASIDGKVPALGQALAASSVPVVLTAAQLSTLTPTALASSVATASNVTVTVAGTRVQFGSNAATRAVIFSAPVGNTGMIYLGDVSVTNASGSKSGIMLTPAGSVRLEISNSNLIYADADTSGDKVYAVAF